MTVGRWGCLGEHVLRHAVRTWRHPMAEPSFTPPHHTHAQHTRSDGVPVFDLSFKIVALDKKGQELTTLHVAFPPGAWVRSLSCTYCVDGKAVWHLHFHMHTYTHADAW
jgi:hypothetical protein